MELLHDSAVWAVARCLEVLALDAATAAGADRVVLFVVVLLAVGVVVDDVEVCCRERLLAGHADETRFVPSACQTTVGGLDRLAFDALVAATAGGLCSRCGATSQARARRSVFRNGRGLGW